MEMEAGDWVDIQTPLKLDSRARKYETQDWTTFTAQGGGKVD